MWKLLIVVSACISACAPTVKERLVEVPVPVKCEVSIVPPAELEKITKVVFACGLYKQFIL